MPQVTLIGTMLAAAWNLLLDSAPYVLFGLAVSGMLRSFLSPSFVSEHLGQGRFASVFKAALLGIPLPLCSCGVLPAAAALKKQGATNGATTAFLIATPESGVDSISISYALLDPIMTVARPLAALLTALVAGICENLLNPPRPSPPDLRMFTPTGSAGPLGLAGRVREGLAYAVGEIWGDLAGWFFVGILVAGMISVLLPDAFISTHLGGGLSSMLWMLLAGIPLYICATASTPIAAALILKGVSPGTALVFLLVGPATNLTSLSVLLGLLGRRATAIYLVAIAVVSVGCGLLLDRVYLALDLRPLVTMGQAAEFLPPWLRLAATLALLALSVRPLAKLFARIRCRAIINWLLGRDVLCDRR